MGIFYFLHNFFPEEPNNHGKRNSKIFIIGIFLYVMLFLFIKHIQVTCPNVDVYYNNIQYGLIIIMIADIAVMGWLYKSFFGRNILHEVTDDENHVYDESTHKYIKNDKNNKNNKVNADASSSVNSSSVNSANARNSLSSSNKKKTNSDIFRSDLQNDQNNDQLNNHEQNDKVIVGENEEEEEDDEDEDEDEDDEDEDEDEEEDEEEEDQDQEKNIHQEIADTIDDNSKDGNENNQLNNNVIETEMSSLSSLHMEEK
jgi:hypothetical protein